MCIRTHDGKKVQRSLETANKAQGKAIEAKIRVEIIEGKYFEKPKVDRVTVKSLIGKYLGEYSEPNKGKITYKNDIYFSKQILEHFGGFLISNLKPRHISKFITDRRKDGVSDTTINHELRLLRHAYKLAILEWELITESPFARIKIPNGDVKRVRYLSCDEEQRLNEALSDWIKPIVTIARETGLRLSNIANLQWKQVDMRSGMIILETTKNGEPHGIPMTDGVFKTLETLNMVKRIDSDYVFVNEKNGKPFRRWWISDRFRKACKKANIDNFRFHDLRHDFCSRLVQRGADLYSVAGLAGHKDIKTTQRYAHLSPEKLRLRHHCRKSRKLLLCKGLKWSGREDSNLRPPAPKAGALTKLRYAPI